MFPSLSLETSVPGQDHEQYLGTLSPLLLSHQLPHPCLRRPGKRKMDPLFYSFLDPLSPLTLRLSQKLMHQFELQICLLCSISCYVLFCQTVKNKPIITHNSYEQYHPISWKQSALCLVFESHHLQCAFVFHFRWHLSLCVLLPYSWTVPCGFYLNSSLLPTSRRSFLLTLTCLKKL